MIRLAVMGLALSFATAAAAQSPGLDAAARNYPPFVLGANVRPADGSPPYARACPPAGSRVEQGGGPAFEYLGAAPGNPELCRVRRSSR